MHIYFKRSGGFTGIPLQSDLDTSSLPAEEAEAIERILADVNFFELPSDPVQTSDADRYSYELKVISEEIEHTVYFSEQNSPVEINTLMRHLIILSRRPDPNSAADSPVSEDKSQP